MTCDGPFPSIRSGRQHGSSPTDRNMQRHNVKNPHPEPQIAYRALQALGVPQPQAKGPPGPGGHNNLSNSVLEGLLYFISPLYGQDLCLFWRFFTLSDYTLTFQYHEPNVRAEVVTTYFNINI